MALTTARNTRRRADSRMNDSVTVAAAASQTFYTGALVCTNSSGYLVPGSTATTLTAVGVIGPQRNRVPAISYTSGSVAGVDLFDVQVGTFNFNQTAGDEFTVANLFKVCYVTDDETVAKTGAGKSVAGRLIALDDDGQAWVEIGVAPVGLAGGVGPTGCGERRPPRTPLHARRRKMSILDVGPQLRLRPPERRVHDLT